MALKFLNDGYFAGKVGIGIQTPTSKLHVNQYVTDPDLDAPSSFAVEIDSNHSGSAVTTGDREQGGLYIDVDSSTTGGDTSNEHRLYGIWNTVNHSGDADLVYGTLSQIEQNTTAGTTSSMIAVNATAISDGGANASLTNITGSYGATSLQDTTPIGSSWAGKFMNNSISNRTGTTANAFGIASEIQIDSTSSITNLYAGHFSIDLNANYTATNSYLLYLEYAGASLATNVYSIYSPSDVKGYHQGSFGIGTPSPDTKLEIVGNNPILTIRDSDTSSSTATSTIRFAESNANDTLGNYWDVGYSPVNLLNFDFNGSTKMTINSSGNVGIGTSSPVSTLEISKSDQTNGATLSITNSFNGSSWDAGDIIGTIDFRSDDTSTTQPIRGQIKLFDDSASGNTYPFANAMSFSTAYLDVLTERMRIDSTGNVGIGTDSPDAKLSLYHATDDVSINVNTGTGGSYPKKTGISFGAVSTSLGGDSEFKGGAGIQAINTASSNNPTDLAFWTTSGGSPTERMRVTSAGGISFGSTGTAYGSSGQILTSAGNASPTWETFDGVTGSGTATQVAFWNSASSLSGDNDLYWDSTNNHLGIGDSTPGSKLKVFSGTSETSLYTVSIHHERNDPNVGTSAMRIKMDLSGADNTTADRTNQGLIIDLDSSANGDASNEHRIIGVNSDVKFDGFSDIARGGFFLVESSYTGAKTAQLAGVYGLAKHSSSSTSGGATNMYGAIGLSSVQNKGDVDQAFGVLAKTDITSARTEDVEITKGVEGQVAINAPTALNYGTMIAVSSVIDNNEGSTPNFGSQYLFKGDYQGTKGGNTYGIWTEGDKNYFSGNVGIGVSSPGVKLHVESASLGANIYDTSTQAIFEADTASSDKLYIQNYRTVAGNAWTSNGKRIQERIDSTWMGYIQFNGGETVSSGNGHISFGTGQSTTQSNVTEKLRITSNAECHLELTGTAPVIKVTASNGSSGLRINTTGQSTGSLFRVQKDGATKFEIGINGDVEIKDALLSNQENTDIDSAAPEVVAQVSITDYTAAFFDFVVKKGTNIRSGTVYACHDGTNVEFTETSTNDLGDTSDVVLSVDKTSTNLRLIATVASDDWSVKSLIRAI